ncbi:MAG: RidA family protein [Proteobacteria bacterium]|nr:RidA family protein [Pseudomonadota bacterium]
MSIVRHESKGILSKAVEHGGLVYLAGITADDRSKNAQGQTEQILATIDKLLAGCGSDKSKVLTAQIWVSDIRLRDEMNVAWNAWTGGKDLPARACIEAALADPKLLVEIMVVAAK